MTIATEFSLRHFSTVEELAEEQLTTTERVPLADLEEMGQEFIRSWRQFKVNFELTKERLAAGKIPDLDGAGNDLLRAIEMGVKAGGAVGAIFDAVHAQGRAVPCQKEFEQARADLHALGDKVRAKWPFVDLKAIERAREEYQAGRHVSSEDLLHGAKVRVPESVVRAIGHFAIDRELRIALFNAIHNELPLADTSQRFPSDDRLFVFQKTVLTDGNRHVFVIVVNDSTSPDDLIVEQVLHVSLDDF